METSAEKTKEYIDKAKKWFNSCPSAWIFGDCKRVTIYSVAEFLANQDGHTIYKKAP